MVVFHEWLTIPYARAIIGKRARRLSACWFSFTTAAPAPAMPQIDLVTYRKDLIHPQRWGYQARGNAVPSSIIIHTTSNKRATRFETEADYLLQSNAVSAHYLVGKAGQIVQFLDPLRWQAWHSGNALPEYLNVRSIGIEHHVSVGEPWTDAQHDASTWLVRQLMERFGIPPARIDTHRAVALPVKRKSDPTGWDNESFYAWRDTLGTQAPTMPPPLTKRYRVKPRYVTQRQEDNGPPVVRELVAGEEVVVDKWYGNGRVHLASGEGFCDLADLEAA